MVDDIQKEAEQKVVEQTPVALEMGAEALQISDEIIEIQPANDAPLKSHGWLIFGAINLLLILVLAGGFFFLLQELKDKQLSQGDEISKDDMREIEVSKQLNAFQSQLGSMQSQIVIFAEDIAGKDSHFTKTLADFSQLHSEKMVLTKNELTAAVEQIRRQLGKTRGDWLVADAEYLLSVANQRLHLVGDVKTSSMALEAADQRLRESGDAAVYKIRVQIAKEIAALGTVTLPDVVGIYSKIQLLKDTSGQLAVRLPYAGKPLTESTEIHAHEDTEESGHGVLESALNLLEGYVTVRHSSQPQLNVKLEMIKVALVQQHNKLYQTSIVDTKQWLNDNYTLNAKAQQFLVDLDEINSMQLQRQLPDISQSFKMLKDIVKLRLEVDKALLPSATTNDTTTEQSIIAPSDL